MGLGNPGVEYQGSRHNLGCKAVEFLCMKWGLRLSHQSFQALSTSTQYHDREIVVACPQAFMNRSGSVVKYLVEYYAPDRENIMVVHDDIDLGIGRIRIIREGGSGGHRGVESIIYHLGTNGFNRTKIGVGRPRYNEPIEDFVLGPPYHDQQETIKGVLCSARDAIELFILDGVESAMNRFNSLTISEKEGER